MFKAIMDVMTKEYKCCWAPREDIQRMNFGTFQCCITQDMNELAKPKKAKKLVWSAVANKVEMYEKPQLSWKLNEDISKMAMSVTLNTSDQ